MKNKNGKNEFLEHNLFWSWSKESAQKTVEDLQKKINLYLIAKIWSHAHSWNEEVLSQLKKPISVFAPHQHNPYNTVAQSFKHEVHDIDLEAICRSQGAILLPPYGNDCAYEVGIYKMLNIALGQGRVLFPVVAVIQEDTGFLKDWMVKAGITHVITNNPKTFKSLKSDPMLGSNNRSIIKINGLDELHDRVVEIMHSVRLEEEPLSVSEESLISLATRRHTPLAFPADA